MRIVYSPYYDSETYLGDSPAAMGEIYVGNMGLLAQLELRAGVPSFTNSDAERETAYLIELKKFIPGTAFESVFNVDDLGTAAKMLAWRDALVMAGWDASMTDAAFPKLSILSKAEAGFRCPGTPDRWRNVRETYRKGVDVTGQIDEIRIDCPMSDIPPIISQTIGYLAGLGVKVSCLEDIDQSYADHTLDVSKVSVIEFDQLLEAYEWIANVQLPADTAVVNRNNMMLNHVLGTWDKPRVQATTSGSNPQALQLFKLGISIFSRPLNVQNLTSYLQLPYNPIPGALRHRLVSLLLSKGGFGEKKKGPDGIERDTWEQIIEDFEFRNTEGKATPQAKARKMKFIEPIRKDYSSRIPKKDIADYIGVFKEWVRGYYQEKDLSDGLKKQFSELLSQLSAFETALAQMDDNVMYPDIEKLALRLYRPMNYTLGNSESGSMNIISDVRSMAVCADTLVWLDCQEEDTEHNPYDFLSRAETEFLAGKGISVPDFPTHLKVVRQERMRLLAPVRSIVLVKSSYNGTERLGEHPMIAEVRQMYSQTHPESNGKLPLADKNRIFPSNEISVEAGNLDVFKPVPYVELGKVEYAGRKESNNSLDMLINYPFDYLMKYVVRLNEPDDGQLQNTYITQGLVAHSFFEHIIADSQGNPDVMCQLVADEFENRLDAAIDVTGLTLRLPENVTLTKNFAVQLRESFLSLVEIMKHLHLTPVGCEIPFPANDEDKLELEKIGDFGARIDFLMKDRNDRYVIFDFKWSYSNSYENKLKDNLAIQLELYRRIVRAAYPDADVAGVGYYLMPKKMLATSDFEAIPGSKLIDHIDAAKTELFGQIQNSFEFRMDELRKGHIEEAEMSDVLNIDGSYASKADEKNLCPVGQPKYEGRGSNRQLVAIVKESQKIFKPSKKVQFENKKEEPSEVATTHAVLKGRLK